MKSPAQKLFDAAWDGDLAVITALCETEPAINAAALARALGAAAYHAKPAACRRLLELGADPNAREESTGETVLHQVITKTTEAAERAEIVAVLVQGGAAVNVRTIPGMVTFCFARDIRTRGETPLHRAAAYGSRSLVRSLLDAGADRTARDAHGETPLTWASWHLRENEILKLLLYGEFEGTIP